MSKSLTKKASTETRWIFCLNTNLGGVTCIVLLTCHSLKRSQGLSMLSEARLAANSTSAKDEKYVVMQFQKIYQESWQRHGMLFITGSSSCGTCSIKQHMKSTAEYLHRKQCSPPPNNLTPCLTLKENIYYMHLQLRPEAPNGPLLLLEIENTANVTICLIQREDLYN